MPAVGLGSYESKDDATDVIYSALKYGYKAIDTADYYGNYTAVGNALDKLERNWEGETNCPVTENIIAPACCKIVDEDQFNDNFSVPHGDKGFEKHHIFVTTKVWPTLSANKVRETVERFQRECNRKQIDLLVLHWPGIATMFGGTEAEMKDPKNAERRLEAWHELERQYAAGTVRAIGVSNFHIRHLEPLVKDIQDRQAAGDIIATLPMVNQIEISPWILPAPELNHYCDRLEMVLQSYSPLGSGSRIQECINDPVIVALQQKYDRPPAAIILRPMMDRGFILKSSSRVLAKKSKLYGKEIKQTDSAENA